jgi:hypothetical protein
LLVEKSVTISGPGTANLAVDGNANSRVFRIGSGKTVSISGLTLTDGNAASGNGGGGILNDHATLTIDNCAVQNSFALAYNYGGGVYNDGSAGSATLTIINRLLPAIMPHSAGGGIYNDASNGGSAMLTITNRRQRQRAAFISDVGLSGGEGGIYATAER